MKNINGSGIQFFPFLKGFFFFLTLDKLFWFHRKERSERGKEGRRRRMKEKYAPYAGSHEER